VPECQKLKKVGYALYGTERSKCNRMITLGFKGLKTDRQTARKCAMAFYWDEYV